MVLLIDANIILDVLMNRQDFVKDSSMIWKLCETEKTKGYVSALTFANLVYIMRTQLNPKAVEDIFRKLSLIFIFTDLSVSDLTRAAELNWNDFEDAVQSVTAERIHADYIITKNVRDFSKSKVMAFTPSELLARIWENFTVPDPL
ncbi:twitching motility protein PilT [Sellimonas catena]|uniref:Twitching motility protein PilT n=2 Tax=Sellimonas catena TaxID=2994035 RepID=A0A9W6CLR4_9FIRM|nr:twitching motility protein PilT [Sellimonas catena]